MAVHRAGREHVLATQCNGEETAGRHPRGPPATLQSPPSEALPVATHHAALPGTSPGGNAATCAAIAPVWVNQRSRRADAI